MNTYFVDYLNNFQNNDNETDRNITDYHLLNNYILTNYYYNNFYHDHFQHMQHVTNSEVSSPSNLYYDCYSQSKWNLNIRSPDNHSNYDIWKTNNEFKFDFSNNDLLFNIPPPPPGLVVQKTKVVIDTNINSIRDLLDIIDNNKLDSQCEYNIDLQSLHNIRDELHNLNNMIGMVDLKKDDIVSVIVFYTKITSR